MLNRTRPGIDPGGTPVVTSFQLDYVPLIFAELMCYGPVSYWEENTVMPVFLMHCRVCLRYCRSQHLTSVLSRQKL